MIYRVVLDGNDILDYSDINLSLISPVLEIEINNAGSLEFVMPPYHKYYDMIHILTSTVEVYEDDILIWFGRPISEKIDFFKQKKVYCEGALSFFNDSVMRPLEIDGSSLHSFFRTLIDSHNCQVASDRTFIVGNITIDDGTVYRKLNYESTYDAIQNMCLSTNDGYLFIRKENGINYIDWLKDMPYECNQQIEFGLNLLNYSSNFDASDFVTCVLPIGKNDSETNQPLTIASINGGSDIIISEAAQTYGKVTKPLSLSDISDPYELMTEGQKYLENSQFNALIIECSAADLHSMNKTVDLFRVGQNVHCISNPHLVDRDFPLSKMQINLDSAAKIITLGIIKRRTLTRIYKQDSESSYQQDSYMPESYDPGVIEDLNGDGWEVIMPDENGGPVTAIRMPIKITIARAPNKTEYKPGETIDFIGLVVNIWTKDKDGKESIWTNPPKYLDGIAPMAELVFSTKTAPSGEGVDGFSVMVTWKYKGKSFSTTLSLTVEPSHDWDIDLQLPLVEEYFYRPIKVASEFQQVLEIVDSNNKRGQVRVVESISNGYFVIGKGSDQRIVLALSTDQNAVIRTTRTIISGDISPEIWNTEITSEIGSTTEYTLLGTAYHHQLGNEWLLRFTQSLNPPVDNELKKPISLSDNFWNQLATLVLDGGPV